MKGSYPVLITDAFILHTRGVSEADRIITALTRENGVMSLYARSIRKEGAKMRGAIKPYGFVSLSAILSGRRNILKDVMVIDTLDAIWEDAVIYTAFVTFLCNIRLYVPVMESCDRDFFTIVETAVRFFKESPPSAAASVLLVAQVMLLTALGYIPDRSIQPAHFSTLLAEVSSSSARRSEFQLHLQHALQYQ